VDNLLPLNHPYPFPEHQPNPDIFLLEESLFHSTISKLFLSQPSTEELEQLKPALMVNHSLRQLDLLNPGAPALQSLAEIISKNPYMMHTVTSLRVDKVGVEDEPLIYPVLQYLHNLTFLECKSMVTGDLLLEKIHPICHHLSTLSLQKVTLGGQEYSQLLTVIRNAIFLQVLDLGYCGIKSSTMGTLISSLYSHPTLQYLNLSGNIIREYSQHLLDLVEKNSSITTLLLRETSFQYFEQVNHVLQKNTTLTELDLSANQMQSSFFDNMGHGLEINRTLTSLKIHDNFICTPTLHLKITNILNALLLNPTLTYLTYLSPTPTIFPNFEMIENRVQQNKKRLISYKAWILRLFITCARDSNNHSSASYWIKIPRDIQYSIFTLISFYSDESIHKTKTQIRTCARFITENIEKISENFQAGKHFALIEKMWEKREKKQFELFFTE
jgi:hypothetical protein